MKGMVSIIIPMYNRQEYIEECIQSIYRQSYQNFEIILIDDGSTDQTVDICQSLANTEPRIKLMIAQHGGVSAARNMGLAQAQGEYIFFLDSDDVIHPLLLEALVTGMKNSDAAIAGTRARAVTERKWDQVQHMMQCDIGPGETIYHSNEEAIHIMFRATTPLSGIGGVMMRKDLIGDTQFRTDIFLGEDAFFIYENIIKGHAVIFLKQEWYYARYHRSNSTWNYSFNGFWSRFYHYKLIWESEASLGRKSNANIRKNAAFSWYTTCLKYNKPHGAECKKIRQAMKAHKKIILPALSTKYKIHFYLSVYFPSIYLKLIENAQRKSVKKK